jgi:aldose 1-epimerase
MYQISATELNGKQLYTIRHSGTGNYASVIADYGGAINEFAVNGRDILLAANTAEGFEQLTRQRYAGNQLFPYPNRVNNARYTHDSVKFALPANDNEGRLHALHGLIYNAPFNVGLVNEKEGLLQLDYQFNSIAGVYPHNIHLSVTYRLKINTFIITSVIKNTGNSYALMGYGWHPYISISGGMNDCKLQFKATDYYAVDEHLIPTGVTAAMKGFNTANSIGDLQLNHCFAVPQNQRRYVTELVDAGFKITLEQHGYNYVQYYISPDRKSIAIEPQTCIPDALNNGTGLIGLLSGEKIELSFEITAIKLTDNE